VDLDVTPGESVGVIGRNGAGKTTMLRILAGITAPTEGVVRVRGRVAPLISVGVGFHPELTGRENVYVNGTVLGMTRREIDARFDEIVAFAEIERFIDTPVKFYSSGMFVRLGFSVAVASQPDVLLVDEVLAVGDAAFQLKSFERMLEIRAAGASVVVVSHNLNAIHNLCSRAMLLRDGQPVCFGATDQTISRYHELLAGDAQYSAYRSDVPREEAAGIAEIVSFELLDSAGRRATSLNTGDEATLRLAARCRRAMAHPVFQFALGTDTGVLVYADRTDGTRGYAAGEEMSCEMRFRLPIGTGTYQARAVIMERSSATPSGDGSSLQLLTGRAQGDPSEVYTLPLLFYVSGREGVVGMVDLQASWVLDPPARPVT
jgi:ABC-type polysaccharide/polyol phosphate transport system ATPase subunit